MPFTQLFPRSFTVGSVRDHAPNVSGLYGITNAGVWIYIGEAENVQEALLDHLREPNTTLLSRAPTGFVYEPCERAKRRDRQDRLVREYEPTCNRGWARQGRIGI